MEGILILIIAAIVAFKSPAAKKEIREDVKKEQLELRKEHNPN